MRGRARSPKNGGRKILKALPQSLFVALLGALCSKAAASGGLEITGNTFSGSTGIAIGATECPSGPSCPTCPDPCNAPGPQPDCVISEYAEQLELPQAFSKFAAEEAVRPTMSYEATKRYMGSESLAYFYRNITAISWPQHPQWVMDTDAAVRYLQDENGAPTAEAELYHKFMSIEKNGGADKTMLTQEEALAYNQGRNGVHTPWGPTLFSPHSFFNANAGSFYYAGDMFWPISLRNKITTANDLIYTAQNLADAGSTLFDMLERRMMEGAKYGFPMPVRAGDALIGVASRGYDVKSSNAFATDGWAEYFFSQPLSNLPAEELALADQKAVQLLGEGATAMQMYVEANKAFFARKRQHVEWMETTWRGTFAPEESAVAYTAQPTEYQFTGCAPDPSAPGAFELFDTCVYGASEAEQPETCCVGGKKRVTKSLPATCQADTTKPTEYAEYIAKIEAALPGLSDVLEDTPAWRQNAIDRKLEQSIDYAYGMDAWYDQIATLNTTTMQTYYDMTAERVGIQGVDLMDRANDAAFCDAYETLQSAVEANLPMEPWPVGCQPYKGDSYIDNPACPFFVPNCNATAYYESGNSPTVCKDPSSIVLREKDFTVCPNIDSTGDWNPDMGASSPNHVVSPYEALPGTCDGLFGVWNFLTKQFATYGTVFSDMVKNNFYNRGEKNSVGQCPSDVFPNFNDNWYSYSSSRTAVEDAEGKDKFMCDRGAYGSYDVQNMLKKRSFAGVIQTFVHEQTLGHSLQIERERDVKYANADDEAAGGSCGYVQAGGSSAVYEGYASYADSFMAFKYGNMGTLFGPSAESNNALAINNIVMNAYADIAVPSGRDTFDEAVQKFMYAKLPYSMRCNPSTEKTKELFGVPDEMMCTRSTGDDYKADAFHSYTSRAHLYPFQMSSYVMGYANAVGLHDKWVDQCGEKFDIREFNYAMITNGGLPLDLTSAAIDEYMEGSCDYDHHDDDHQDDHAQLPGSNTKIARTVPGVAPVFSTEKYGSHFARQV